MKPKKSQSIVGRIAQVDVCPRDAGFVLSVGPVSIWLQLEAAQDVVATLAQALLLEERRARAPHANRGEKDPEHVEPRPTASLREPRVRGTSN
jgi:hypothetical protein